MYSYKSNLCRSRTDEIYNIETNSDIEFNI